LDEERDKSLLFFVVSNRVLVRLSFVYKLHQALRQLKDLGVNFELWSATNTSAVVL
jgi:hypothetical protein